jgi:hypothetical protein
LPFMDESLDKRDTLQTHTLTNLRINEPHNWPQTDSWLLHC